MAAGKCRLQVEGTCIGNQISPILSGLPVLMAKRQFLLSLPTTLSSSFLFLRYVDNRLLLAPTATLQSEQLKAFCDPIPGQLRKLKQLYVQAGFPANALQ